MKRILCSILLIVALLAGLMQPIFATQEPSSEVRSVQNYSTSEAGIAFVNEMMGGSYAGTNQLASAESTVNSFINRYSVSLSQQQFDALVDLVMAYGSYILTSGYKVETLIGSGNYTDLQIANAFCSWVKDGSEFSQSRLNRRLREIKLFLYGSYDGITEKVTFRYVIYYPNGGSLNDNTVLCYTLNGTYSTLPTASRSGKYFAGWYTAASGGTHLCNSDTVTGNQTVYARWSDTAVENPNEAGSSSGFPAIELRTSENCIQFIKQYEGFCKYAIWDYGQYSIGYGTRCDPSDYPNGITEEEADYLLRVMLMDFEKVIEKLETRRGSQFTASQFDALLSFTFNLGEQWISSSNRIYQCVINGNYTELELLNAMGSWASAGGTILTALMRRRMDEANIFLNGNYEKGSTVYFGIHFNAMSGEVQSRVQYYITGERLGSMPGASRSGYRFLGWFDKAVGGTEYTVDTIAPSYGTLTLYAHWEEAPVVEDPQPTESTAPSESEDPTESTEPTETTEPTEATEPTESTEPDEPIDPESGFSDVQKSAWYYEYVLAAVNAGLFSGVSETRFAPNSTMTRAMLVTVLHRLAGSPEATANLPFTDVQEGAWYEAAVRWAYETGIVNGISDTKFGVDRSITREQLTTMLFRYANYFEYDTSARADLTIFDDDWKISSYAYEAMQWAACCGIVSGDGINLTPTGNATRAQCAKMIVIFSQLIADQQVLASATAPAETTEAPLPTPSEPVENDDNP